MIKLNGEPFNISIIQIYAPTQDHEDEETELFYDEIQTAIKNVKTDNIFCVMEDLNAKVDKERTTDITGQYGLGTRNERGERLLEFCQQNELIITKKLF